MHTIPFDHIRLTLEEAEVLARLAEGISNDAIARELALTVAAVESRIHRFIDKHGLRGRKLVASTYSAPSSHAQATSVLGWIDSFEDDGFYNFDFKSQVYHVNLGDAVHFSVCKSS